MQLSLFVDDMIIYTEISKESWRRKWRPTPVFLPGESRGQRNLVGYSPWDCKESDTTSNSVRQHPYKESLFVCLSFSLLKRNSEVGVTLKSTGVYS